MSLFSRPFSGLQAGLLVIFTAIAGLAPAVPVPAQTFEKNILTGGPTGTYIQFGRDIAGIAAECGITLNVRESAGSLENFVGVRQRSFTQFGIVQSDVLEYLRTYAANDPEMARTIAGVRIAFPLYNEEVHLLARADIGSLADLAGRRVAVGVENSGTHVTATLVLDLAEVAAERVQIGPDESLRQLLAGEIDAFFYVAGAPTKLFQTPGIAAGQFHLLALTDPVLQAVYTPATIPDGTYPFQSGPVEAVAVKAVLMTYDYRIRKNRYHRASCDAVRSISHLVLRRFDALKETGHPKWSQVDLTDIPPGWEVAACVNMGIDPEFSLPCTREDATAGPGANEANALYRRRVCAAIGGC
ncbi:TAXI family TRAP transporter solute-binding subunit [Rhodovulum sulfidophilum]|uniref:TAXI family TRAP transporter solute-binding subunit n=1 Tax=Rhodovulum sulfidophilum TaxID=35806 RepID=A0ABS1RPW2_RHOSU|nr:TAXI family TRAP transporter solute-binding subunit [Rhodovulum sulfidophilum]MBL3608099.1 TAXI family TRAP transporter solute-binding subunit [Rhodovulum sulfidophilum]MCE8459237.1 TAXI family TRAP transporter solute-binding subunit [Rhodovulum sulfidophilum]